MRHRSPRPVLDRLLRSPAPGTVRRGALVAAAVTGVGALGITVAGPLVDLPSGEGPAALGSPVTATAASWSIGTPSPSATGQREPRPSRAGERSTSPTQPEHEPAPQPEREQQPSAAADEQSSPRPSRSSEPSPSPSERQSPTPSESSAPDTDASTSEVEDDTWTVESESSKGDSFECSLDGGGYVPCDPTETFDDLDDGQHTLEVRAVDEDGDVDPSPVELVTDITDGLLD